MSFLARGEAFLHGEPFHARSPPASGAVPASSRPAGRPAVRVGTGGSARPVEARRSGREGCQAGEGSGGGGPAAGLPSAGTPGRLRAGCRARSELCGDRLLRPGRTGRPPARRRRGFSAEVCEGELLSAPRAALRGWLLLRRHRCRRELAKVRSSTAAVGPGAPRTVPAAAGAGRAPSRLRRARHGLKLRVRVNGSSPVGGQREKGRRNVEFFSASGDRLAWVRGWKDSSAGDGGCGWEGVCAGGHQVPGQTCPEKHRSLSRDKV